MKRNGITLNDVAREARVSPASVSRVLNGNSRIGDDTRSRVMAAVEKLGYDAAEITSKAQLLANTCKRHCKFELLLCPLNEQKNMLQLDFYSRIFEGIQGVLLPRRNVELSLLTLGQDSAWTRPLQNRLLAADGVFVLGQQGVNDSFFEPLLEKNIPVVTIGRRSSDPRINSIEHDDLDSAARMVRFLQQKGIKSVSTLNIAGSAVFERRLMSILFALQGGGGTISMIPGCVAASSEDREIRFAFREWLKAGKLPQCMIATHLNAANVIYDSVRESGLRCPQDLSVITFDTTGERLPGTDIVFSGFKTMPEEMGRKAALRLFELIAGSDSAHRILVPLPFVEGNSVIDKK